jgi:ABC-type transporter Mla subunit MlaD
MQLQDLTPQLRTRLRRLEKIVGWFVLLAVLILLGGFVFYLYSMARTRGWFVTKLNYATGVNDASGFNPGDPVRLMGFDVGEITKIVPNDPAAQRGVTLFFNIRQSHDGFDYFGYIWWDSKVRVISDFLGHRFLEVEKGKSGQPSVYRDAKTGNLMMMNRPLAAKAFKKMEEEFRAQPENKGLPDEVITNQVTSNLMELIKSHRADYYTNAFQAGFNRPVDRAVTNYFWVPPLDSPALEDRLEAVAGAVEKALPNILSLTNQIAEVLSNANLAVGQLNATLAQAHPTLTNLAVITGNLRDPSGSLGNWLLTTNFAVQLEQTLRGARETLQAAHTTLDDTDTNITKLATDLDQTLDHLSDLTSNLAWEVQINTNLVSDLSTTIVHADSLIQGLKREWFLRSSFKKKKDKPATADSAKP